MSAEPEQPPPSCAPTPPAPLSPTEATQRFSRAFGERHEVLGVLTGGETGATAIGDDQGRRWVLKWVSDPDSRARRETGVALTERLRTRAHWPVPRQITQRDGPWLFVRQEFMPGRPVEHLGTALADDLLAAHATRLGLAQPSDPDHWAVDLITTLTEGGTEYCLHHPFRTHDRRTRALIERIEELGRSLSPADLSGNDVVHWDLHAGNLLQEDGRLRTVVDLDHAKIGDAAFDLVTLAMSSLTLPADEGVRRRLFAAAYDGLDEHRRLAYVGHLLVRFMDWPIRRHRPDEVEFWLAQSDRLLAGR